MKVRMRELRNVLRRVIAESGLTYDDLDSEDDELDVPGEDDQDAVQSALHAAIQQDGLDIDAAIAMVSANFPGVPLEVIEDIAAIEYDAMEDESITGPASMRPAVISQHTPSVRTTMGYN